MLALLLPFGLAVSAVVWAAVLHVSLALLGGARGGYGATLKAVCYSWSALAFNVFPVCGAAVGAIWQAVLQVIGMRELHRTSTARAFWAWFRPFLVAFCLAGVLVGAALLGLAKFWQQFAGGQFEVQRAPGAAARRPDNQCERRDDDDGDVGGVGADAHLRGAARR